MASIDPNNPAQMKIAMEILTDRFTAGMKETTQKLAELGMATERAAHVTRQLVDLLRPLPERIMFSKDGINWRVRELSLDERRSLARQDMPEFGWCAAMGGYVARATEGAVKIVNHANALKHDKQKPPEPKGPRRTFRLED